MKKNDFGTAWTLFSLLSFIASFVMGVIGALKIYNSITSDIIDDFYGTVIATSDFSYGIMLCGAAIIFAVIGGVFAAIYYLSEIECKTRDLIRIANEQNKN